MCMIFVNNHPLRQTQLSYLAFRIAFCETLERINLARQFRDCPQDGFGYLTEVPFLRNVAPFVQLDLLAATWQRHASDELCQGTLLDESVIYAVCERAAWCVENESPGMIRHYLKSGPLASTLRPSKAWSKAFRQLHLRLSNEADYLLISQFEDLPPNRARELKRNWGIDPRAVEPLFEALERWHPSGVFYDNLRGLLDEREIARVAAMLPRQLSSR